MYVSCLRFLFLFFQLDDDSIDRVGGGQRISSSAVLCCSPVVNATSSYLPLRYHHLLRLDFDSSILLAAAFP